MPSKRRNNGRAKNSCGRTRTVRCVNCGRCVPKDKAIKRYNVRNIVDASSRKDIKENSINENYNLPKLYIQQIYCVSCAIHSRHVRSRARKDRKIRFTGERRPLPPVAVKTA